MEINSNIEPNQWEEADAIETWMDRQLKRISELEAEVAKWKQTDNVRLEADNTRLRECLKRLESQLAQQNSISDSIADTLAVECKESARLRECLDRIERETIDTEIQKIAREGLRRELEGR